MPLQTPSAEEPVPEYHNPIAGKGGKTSYDSTHTTTNMEEGIAFGFVSNDSAAPLPKRNSFLEETSLGADALYDSVDDSQRASFQLSRERALTSSNT